MLYGLVIAIHVIVCLVLISVILLQAGRGGGMAEAFGGGSTQTLFGTKANVVLTRATEISAVVFLITCIVLGIMTSKRGKSLIRLQDIVRQAQTLPATQPIEGAIPVDGETEGVTLDEAKKDLPEAKPETLPAE